MKDIQLLIDFGSTFTKVVAVDLAKEEIVSRVQVPSTVEKDITIGLREALKKVEAEAKINAGEKRKGLACSSAAGGLRMVCIGFVPELTREAATRAALGAGAKIVGEYAYELNSQEISEMEEISPDIILLAGGTDGGNRRVIVHNALMLANSPFLKAHLVVAGNKAAQHKVKAILQAAGKPVSLTRNVMPDIGMIDVDPCREVIRKIFMKKITETKGIAKARTIIKDVLMPTPQAVLAGAQLLSQGYMEESGWGELMVVDIGGATTDVHSISRGIPTQGDITVAGLPEPYVKRTVEGDLGVRHNICTLVELGRARGTFPEDGFGRAVAMFSSISCLPECDEEFVCDAALACTAVEIATERHSGKIEVVYGPMGKMMRQRGKDLTEVGIVIGTGGPIIFSRDPNEILKHSLFDERNVYNLKPKHPDFYIDDKYILYAMGLLSKVNPREALSLMKRYIKRM
jgi:uncharacterized protein (TIGR01319 family)